MSIDKNIAFLGAGQMAGALLEGLLRAGASTPERIMVTDVRPERLDELEKRHGVRVGRSNPDAARWADVVVLATKPLALGPVLAGIAGDIRPDALVVSIAAGVPIAVLEAKLPEGTRCVRTMPNTPATVGAGATAIASGTHASNEDMDLVEKIFRSVGTTVRVDESLLDAVTGLSGSGPAYVFLIAEALADGGVRAGLPRDVATQLAQHTLLGAAKILIETGEHPGHLKDMVASPGGTTIAGLSALERGAVRGALIDAVERATERSRELGDIASRQR